MCPLMDGFINFYKVPGIPSNKALDTIKRASGEKKAGFLGTLDPIAAGILPVGLGWATRLFPYFETLPKTYRATLILGSETDTQDGTGAVTREAPFAHVTKEVLEAAMEKFRGEIDQVPPMYSAKKVEGKRLYEIARSGGEVERKPKKVTIHKLELNEFNGTGAVLTATVSRGTYIRALCEDIGRAVNSAAHMGALIRIEASNFKQEDSWTIERLEERRDHPEEWLLPLDYPIAFMPRLLVGGRDERLLSNGQQVMPAAPAEGLYRLYREEGGAFIGVGRVDKFTKRLMPERLVPGGRPQRYGKL